MSLFRGRLHVFSLHWFVSPATAFWNKGPWTCPQTHICLYILGLSGVRWIDELMIREKRPGVRGHGGFCGSSLCRDDSYILHRSAGVGQRGSTRWWASENLGGSAGPPLVKSISHFPAVDLQTDVADHTLKPGLCWSGAGAGTLPGLCSTRNKPFLRSDNVAGRRWHIPKQVRRQSFCKLTPGAAAFGTSVMAVSFQSPHLRLGKHICYAK